MRALFSWFLLVVPLAAAAQSSLPPCPADTSLSWHKCWGRIFSSNLGGYEGEYLDDKKSGYGTYTDIDGSRYVGEWKSGKRDGEGIEYNQNGTIRRSGEWRDDQLISVYGVITARFPFDTAVRPSAAGLSMLGVAKSALPACPTDTSLRWHRCWGRISMPLGAVYEGEYADDKKSGYGVFVDFDGSQYVGQWSSGKRDGQGIEYQKNGAIRRSGTWNLDEFTQSHSVAATFFPFDFLVAAAQPITPKASCGILDPSVTFADGTQACVSEFSWMSRARTINGHVPSIRARAKTYAIAVSAEPARCPLAVSAWNNLGTPNNAREALAMCIQTLAGLLGKSPDPADSTGCTCEVIFENGVSKLTRSEAEMRFAAYDHYIQTGKTIRQTQIASTAFGVGIKIPIPVDATQLLGPLDGQEVRDKPLADAQSLLEAHAARDQRAADADAALKRQQELEQRLAAETLEMQKQAAEAEQVRLKDQKEKQLLAEKVRQEQAERARQQAELQARLKSEEDARRKEQQAREQSEQRVKQEQAERERLAAEVERLRIELTRVQQIANPANVAYRKAFVVGIDSYKHITKLSTAREDARAMAAALTSAGFSVSLHLDLGEKDLRAAWRKFATEVDGGDEVAFFFAGHGVQLSGLNYLIPADVAGESEWQLRDDSIPLQRLLDDMTERKAKLTLAVIDACRDNPFRIAGRNVGNAVRGLAPTTPATGQMVIFSAGSGQRALDNLGPNDRVPNGVFTRVFIQEMKQRGIPIDAVARKARSEVVRLAKSIGHDQVPAIYDQLVGEFFLLK